MADRRRRQALRDFLAAASPSSEVRRLMETETGYDGAAWRRMADELGLQGTAIPTRYGGAGLPFSELVDGFEEMGRVLLCAPFLSTVGLAATALTHSGDAATQADLLPGIAAGRTIATLAGDLDRLTVEAEPAGEEWQLTGQVPHVLDGHVADVVLVVASTQAGPSLFAVAAGAPGMTRTPLPTMDLTRKQARIEMTSTPGRLVGDEGAAATGVARALDLAAVALAAEQVGGTARCLEMAVEHANQRLQFGRPVGSFQAVKHRCADMLVDLELARSALGDAAGAAVEPDKRLPVAASVAQAWCSDAYLRVAGATIQVHGGVGCTWDHDAHLYFKRAKSSQLLLGDPHRHRRRLAGLLGI